MAGFQKELWEGYAGKRMRDMNAGAHYAKCKNFSSKVAVIGTGNQAVAVINMREIGIDPTILVDNLAYPIIKQALPDGPVLVTLRKLDSTVTPITDDELYAVEVDVIAEKLESHMGALMEKRTKLANWSLAPQNLLVGTGLQQGTTIILTTGTPDPVTLLRPFSPKLLAKAQRHMNDKRVPLQGRMCVLCSQHLEEWGLVDEQFDKQWQNREEGKPLRRYGFDVYNELDMPVYWGTNAQAATMQKQPIDQAVNAQDRPASFFYAERHAIQAHSNVKVYNANSAEDPYNRETVIGTRQYTIVTPTIRQGMGAIVSDR